MAPTRRVDLICSFPEDKILGMGRTGLVVRQGHLAVKLPLKWSISSDEEVEANIKSLQHEQAIYQRLGRCDGIVPFVDCSETATRFQIMENGDLRSYLSRNKPPKYLQLSWFREMARTLAYVHEHQVLVADIASRNFLLDSDLSIKLCDFTESSKLPLDTCMETANDEGYSIHTDIGQLGAVMYEVIVGEKCDFDIFKNVAADLRSGTWPQREDLPSTQGIWLGQIIERCWTEGGFRNACDLSRELESVELQSEKKLRRFGRLSYMAHCMVSFQWSNPIRPTVALAVAFGAISIYIWRYRRT